MYCVSKMLPKQHLSDVRKLSYEIGILHFSFCNDIVDILVTLTQFE